jgi:hypothetical protein
MTAAARHPEPDRPSAAEQDVDGLAPSPEWVGDELAARKFDSPEAIRAALLPEQTDEFDAAYDAALTAARQTLHLDELRGLLRTWRRVALLTELDPDGQRQMFATIAETRRTRKPRPGSVPWSALKKDLGL